MVQSFLAHHPGSTCWLFMPDDPDGIERRLADQFCRRMTIADLPIDGAEFARQAAIYRPDELAQSSKPLVLQAVLDQIDEPCAYLDADIEVYGALDALPGLLGDAELALTPHWSGSQGAAEAAIDDWVLLQSGAFNSGFVVVGPGGRPFLDWWQQRCRRDSIHDPDHHLLVDQRWLDLAAAQFPCRVIRDPGYNVAYWNVAERGLTVDDGGYRADDAPLRFFHFSGFDPAHPQVLSGYTDDGYLERLDCPALGQLLAEHAEALAHQRSAAEPGSVPVRRRGQRPAARPHDPPARPRGDEGRRARRAAARVGQPVRRGRRGDVRRLAQRAGARLGRWRAPHPVRRGAMALRRPRGTSSAGRRPWPGGCATTRRSVRCWPTRSRRR